MKNVSGRVTVQQIWLYLPRNSSAFSNASIWLKVISAGSLLPKMFEQRIFSKWFDLPKAVSTKEPQLLVRGRPQALAYFRLMWVFCEKGFIRYLKKFAIYNTYIFFGVKKNYVYNVDIIRQRHSWLLEITNQF